MNELDKKILELFCYLINSGTKHLCEIDYGNCVLEYKIDNKEITLSFYKIDAEKEIKPNSYSTAEKFIRSWEYFPSFAGVNSKTLRPNSLDIQFSIRLGGRWYMVPKLSRLEQAQTLDRIDAILEEKESEILDSVIGKLTGDSSEEL